MRSGSRSTGLSDPVRVRDGRLPDPIQPVVVLSFAVRGPVMPLLLQLVLLTDPSLLLAGCWMLVRCAEGKLSLSALAVATSASASRSLRWSTRWASNRDCRFVSKYLAMTRTAGSFPSQVKHVMSHIMRCASTVEVGKVREGQEIEFLASLVIVQEVVDHMVR